MIVQLGDFMETICQELTLTLFLKQVYVYFGMVLSFQACSSFCLNVKFWKRIQSLQYQQQNDQI